MELYQKTAAELSSLIHAGEVSASEVCRAVLIFFAIAPESSGSF